MMGVSDYGGVAARAIHEQLVLFFATQCSTHPHWDWSEPATDGLRRVTASAIEVYVVRNIE